MANTMEVKVFERNENGGPKEWTRYKVEYAPADNAKEEIKTVQETALRFVETLPKTQYGYAVFVRFFCQGTHSRGGQYRAYQLRSNGKDWLVVRA